MKDHQSSEDDEAVDPIEGLVASLADAKARYHHTVLHIMEDASDEHLSALHDRLNRLAKPATYQRELFTEWASDAWCEMVRRRNKKEQPAESKPSKKDGRCQCGASPCPCCCQRCSR